MKSKILLPACTGLTALALGACGSKETPPLGKAPQTAPTPTPASAPATALSAEQKSTHFDAVSAHLDLGGEVYGYLDVDGDAEKLAGALQDLLELAKEAGGGEVPTPIANLKIESVLDDLGLTGIEAMGMSSYKNGDLYHNKFYVHTPEGRTGMLKIFGGEAEPFVTQKLAPAGSDLVMEQRLDLKSAFEMVRDLVTKVGGPEAAGEFARMTTEPMPGGPPMSIADVFSNLDTRLSVVARVHPDKPMPLPDEVPLKVPGIDAMIALDNLGPLVTQLIASIPEEQREGMIEEGDGFQQMAIPVPLPPELAQTMQPIVRHDITNGRVLIATSPAFLDECLSGKSSVWDDDGFKAAMTGLPQEGNALSFASSKLMAEYLRIYGDALDLTAQEGGPVGLSEVVVGMLQTMGMSPDHDQASVMTNLPEGMLMVQNSAASAKQSVVMMGAAFVGGAATGFLMPMAYQSRADTIEVFESRAAAEAELHDFEEEFRGETPRETRPTVPEPVPVPDEPTLERAPVPVPVPE